MNFSELRKAAGLTQHQVALLAGYTDRQIVNWEQNKARVPKLVTEALERLLQEKQNGQK